MESNNLVLSVVLIRHTRIIERFNIGSGRWSEGSKRPRIPHGATGKDTTQVSTTTYFCEFYFYRILIDRANSHTKSYYIPRSFEAMYINIKHELRAWVTCVLSLWSIGDLFHIVLYPIQRPCTT